MVARLEGCLWHVDGHGTRSGGKNSLANQAAEAAAAAQPGMTVWLKPVGRSVRRAFGGASLLPQIRFPVRGGDSTAQLRPPSLRRHSLPRCAFDYRPILLCGYDRRR